MPVLSSVLQFAVCASIIVATGTLVALDIAQRGSQMAAFAIGHGITCLLFLPLRRGSLGNCTTSKDDTVLSIPMPGW